MKVAAELRNSGLQVELYPDAAKMKKQMAYADKKGVRFVALCGENERTANQLTLKKMATGEQWTLTVAEAVEQIKA